MALFGSSWRDEDPSEEEKERFRSITGEEFTGSRKDLEKRVDFLCKSGQTATLKEHLDLRDLLQDLDKEE